MIWQSLCTDKILNGTTFSTGSKFTMTLWLCSDSQVYPLNTFNTYHFSSLALTNIRNNLGTFCFSKLLLLGATFTYYLQAITFQVYAYNLVKGIWEYVTRTDQSKVHSYKDLFMAHLNPPLKTLCHLKDCIISPFCFLSIMLSHDIEQKAFLESSLLRLRKVSLLSIIIPKIVSSLLFSNIFQKFNFFGFTTQAS